MSIASEVEAQGIGRFHRFIDHFNGLIESAPDEEHLLQKGTELLRKLVRTDDWLPAEFAAANPARYRQYLLHADPWGRYSVVSFVWGPGQSTPIHDHTVWGLIGMLRGSEQEQHFARKPDNTLVPNGPPHVLEPGQVDAVSPSLGDLHRVSNSYSDQVSISIHVYGANIGEVQRSIYEPSGERKSFVSGYSNADAGDLFISTHLKSAAYVRSELLAGRELALLDVREEAFYAEGHPLFASNLPLSKIEMEAYTRLPSLTSPIVVFSNGEGLTNKALVRLLTLGYQDVSLLDGGLQGWSDAGYELFRDVNVPSKAFGELVEATRHTPSLSAEEVKSLIDRREDVVIVDARQFDEYQTMSIPTAISVPGGELALRIPTLAPDPKTRIIVNCAGRTRSILGTQSLINAGIQNQVAALRNGTIGWKLANQQLEHGQTWRFPDTTEGREGSGAAARQLADRTDVRRTTLREVHQWVAADEATIYRFDVRTPEEFERGHLRSFRNAPGGQLVQETDVFAPVRHATIVLADDDGVRANMAASWLAQMNWKVFVIDGLTRDDFSEAGKWESRLPSLPQLPEGTAVSPHSLQTWLEDLAGSVIVLDLAGSREYEKQHLTGAWFALRSTLGDALQKVSHAEKIVLTSPDGVAASFAWAEASALTSAPVFVLDGGTDAWLAAGHDVTDQHPRYASAPTDRYRRPYEGTDIEPSVMQAYLDWEFGLVEQLKRDATHGFRVL